MDWQEPSDDHRVVLAITRIRATDKSDYRGPVIFNPGVSKYVKISSQDINGTLNPGSRVPVAQGSGP